METYWRHRNTRVDWWELVICIGVENSAMSLSQEDGGGDNLKFTRVGGRPDQEVVGRTHIYSMCDQQGKSSLCHRRLTALIGGINSIGASASATLRSESGKNRQRNAGTDYLPRYRWEWFRNSVRTTNLHSPRLAIKMKKVSALTPSDICSLG